MEISEIGRLAKTKPLQKSKPVEVAAPVWGDKLTLSPEAIEAQKKARFVAMLKEMSEVRMPSTGPVERVIAQKIYEQDL